MFFFLIKGNQIEYIGAAAADRRHILNNNPSSFVVSVFTFGSNCDYTQNGVLCIVEIFRFAICAVVVIEFDLFGYNRMKQKKKTKRKKT